MTELVLSIIVYSALHALPSTPLRKYVIERFGRSFFMAALSILTVILTVWMWLAYRHAADNVETVFWVTGVTFRIISAGVMFIAILLTVWMATNRPLVLISGEHILENPGSVRGVLRITRHPLMWPLGLWALMHFFNNADPAGFLFFGYFVFLAFAGTLMIDKRRKSLMGDVWERLAGETSTIPFAAIIMGRNKFVWSELGWPRLISAIIIWSVILHFHDYLTGYPVF